MAKAKSNEAAITVRQIALDFSKTPRYWLEDNAYSTHFVHGLSLLFPEGERMFVRAVKHFQGEVTDLDLKRAVAGFIGQEMMHGKTHELMNEWLVEQWPNAQRLQEDVDQQIKSISNLLMTYVPMGGLALTVALEHLTSILAQSVLTHPKILEKMHPSVRPLLIWHAIEEIEHKAVAFDVYVAAGGSYLRRVVWLLIAGVMLIVRSSYLQTRLLAGDGSWRDVKGARSFLSDMYGREGLVTAMLGNYFRAFSPRFHPNHTSEDGLVRTWSKRLERMIKVHKSGRALAHKVAG